MARRFLVFLAATCVLFPSHPRAQDREAPYWASLRVDKINMRVGPAESYRIEWVYKRTGLPVKVVRRQEGWRLVEDPAGARGWMLARFLSRDRTALVIGDEPAEMRDRPGGSSRLLWRVESGVTGRLGDCRDGWCAFDADGHLGQIRQDRLWGAGEP